VDADLPLSSSSTAAIVAISHRPGALLTRTPDARAPLARSLGVVGPAVAFSGLSTYGYLVLSARALGVEAYAPFAVAWSLALVVAAGVFVPLEQETARAVAVEGARGRPPHVVVRRLGVGAAALAAGCALLTAVLALPLLPLLDRSVPLLVALGVVGLGLAPPFLLRGLLSGQQRFGAYSAVVVAEGFLRVSGAAVLMALGVRSAAPYLAMVALSASLSACAGLAVVGTRGRGAGEAPLAAPAATGTRTTAPGRRGNGWGGLATLVTAALLSQVLLNVGPVLVALLAQPDERAAASRLLAGMVLARVPLFLFSAVQAALVPRLTGDATRDDLDSFGRTVRVLILGVTALTAVLAGVLLLVGEPLLALLFGADFRLSGPLLALLALGVGCYLVAATAGSALLALGRHGALARGWLVGLATLAVVTAVVPDLLQRIALGFAVGCAASALALLTDLRSSVARRGRDTSVGDVTPAA
jgi:O-antigen/teichoic acid export membrane protein